MTKEELEQEAEEFVCSKKSFWKQGRTCVESVRQAYIASGEPREKRIAELEKENAELKEVHESDKRSLALIAKKGAGFEKAYNEAEELLDKQIEATYKLFEENKELKEKLKPENCLKLLAKEGYIKLTSDQLTKAKTIIQDLLDNTDEYARQRAEDFLKENKKL